MRKSIPFLSCIMVFATLPAFAQDTIIDALPENPESGKCYAKCIEPDEYNEEQVRVMVSPAYKTLEIVPAEYETITETVVIKPAEKKYKYIPATYRTVYDTIITKEDYNDLDILPEEFRDDLENIEIKSAYGKWIAGEKDPDCPSINKEDCRIFHFKEFEAVYRDVPIKRLVKNQTTSKKLVEGKYTVIERQVEVTPGRTEEEIIPEVTKEVTRQVLAKDESTREIEVPAEYEEVAKQVMVKAGGMSVWREVPCTITEELEVLPILWNLGSAELTPAAKRIIDEKLYAAAQKKKNSIVEITSHTDARGSNESNQSLSERRAKSVAEYLISKGIKKGRILAIGYGESRLKNDCADGVTCSESKHAANRRTEFRLY